MSFRLGDANCDYLGFPPSVCLFLCLFHVVCFFRSRCTFVNLSVVLNASCVAPEVAAKLSPREGGHSAFAEDCTRRGSSRIRVDVVTERLESVLAMRMSSRASASRWYYHATHDIRTPAGCATKEEGRPRIPTASGVRDLRATLTVLPRPDIP